MAVTESAQKLPATLSRSIPAPVVSETADIRGNQKFSIDVADGAAEIEVAWTDQDSEVFNSLTEKQRQFVIEYLLDFNSTRAAKRAGYKCSNDKHYQRIGYALLRHPKVGPLTRKASQQTADELGITRGWLLGKVRDLATSAEKDGDKVGASRAYALLAKLRGDMIDRKEIDVRQVNLNINGIEMGDLR